MDESMLHFSTEKLDELTRALFEDADVDHSGTISFEELQAELDKHPGVLENLSIRLVASSMLVTRPGPHKPKDWFEMHRQNLRSSIFCAYAFSHLHKGLHVYIYMSISNTLCDCNNWEKISEFTVIAWTLAFKTGPQYIVIVGSIIYCQSPSYSFLSNFTPSAAKWLNPPVAQRKRSLSTTVPHWLSWRYIRNNLAWVIWIILYFAVNILLFVEAAIRHRESVRVVTSGLKPRSQ